MHFILSFLKKITPIANAHCDIPCGIYTSEPSLTAARTVLKMVEKIQGAQPNDAHAICRFTATKEEHAQKCKQELLILWTDYFKQEHLAMFPNLHEVFWKAAKLCSRNKQVVSMESAQELLKAVEEIARTFEQAVQALKRPQAQ